MVHLRSLISIPLLRQVTLTKKEKVLDPPSTVNSTRELNDKRQKIQAMLYFCLFPPTSHYCWNVIQKTENKLKKTCNEKTARTKSTFGLFQPKRKTNFYAWKSKHWEGWPFAKMVRHLNKSAGARELSRQTLLQKTSSLLQDTFPNKHTINWQPPTCL